MTAVDTRADAKPPPSSRKRKRPRLSASSSFSAVLSALRASEGWECKPVSATSLSPDSHVYYTGRGAAKFRRGEPVTKGVDFFETSVDAWQFIRKRGASTNARQRCSSDVLVDS